MSNLQTIAATKNVVWSGEKSQYNMWKKKFIFNSKGQKLHEGFTLNKDDYQKIPEGAKETEQKRIKKDIENYMDKNNKLLELLVNSINHNKR